MIVSVEQFIARYPEFGPVEPNLIEAVLQEAEEDCPASFWDSRSKPLRRARAIMLLAAHILAARWIQIGEIAAQAASLASGSSSAAPTSATTSSDQVFDLTGTEYGRQLMMMQSQIAATGFVF